VSLILQGTYQWFGLFSPGKYEKFNTYRVSENQLYSTQAYPGIAFITYHSLLRKRREIGEST